LVMNLDNLMPPNGWVVGLYAPYEMLEKWSITIYNLASNGTLSTTFGRDDG